MALLRSPHSKKCATKLLYMANYLLSQITLRLGAKVGRRGLGSVVLRDLEGAM